MDYEQPQQPSQNTPTNNLKNFWREVLNPIGLSVIFAFGIRTFVAESRYIPSESMLPTLQVNDKLIIDKVSYRFADPVRGDIVVFNPTAQMETEKDNDGKQKFKDAFIKRVIGLPGDRVDVKNGKVYINSKIITEPYLSKPPRHNWSTSDRLTSGDHPIPWPTDGRVPPGQYLVLGDNRNNSYDSHYWGFVPRDKIIGKATIRFWPIDHTGWIETPPSYVLN